MLKIAVVGPSPVPFTIGGNENLSWNLCTAINQFTPNQCDLIKLPVRENSFWDLIDSYKSFYDLNLDQFDMIISTKYPSWMVRHKNSICYMVHTLRGLYDCYSYFSQPYLPVKGNCYVDELVTYMSSTPAPENLDDFFRMIENLRAHRAEVPEDYFAFPAPFIRMLVHYMDQWGLSQPGVKRYYAISDTVKNRLSYFPEKAKVTTVYPRPPVKGCGEGDYRYIFMISRLDAPKRIDMLVRAMRYVKSDIKLLIAGTGPEADNLKKLAEADDRIEFLGFVSDDEVEEYYANALVIPYFPANEDLGYITIEAMMHAKPVITTRDAGGPMEFVKDGLSGFVTDFDERQIAEKIDYLAEHPREAKRMGKMGKETVSLITWENAVSQLLSENGVAKVQHSGRKSMVVLMTFSIWPPVGGGQARSYSLYREFAREYDVTVLVLCDKDSDTMIAEGLREICIKKSEEHLKAEGVLTNTCQIPASDISALLFADKTPKYGRKVQELMQNAEYVMVCHPYLYPEAAKYLKQQILLYDAQDVESYIKKQMLPEFPDKQKITDCIYQAEKSCLERSAFVYTCSEEDKNRMMELYGTASKKLVVVPNGVSCEEIDYVSPEIRKQNKKRLKISGEKLGLFVGSWHGPNLDACEWVFRLANMCPEIKFLLMGSQCQYLKQNHVWIPPNVALLGLLSDEEKRRVFSCVDFALNPITSGSGTNLKMFEYMAAGIPIISTTFGTRGIERKDCFLLADTDEEFVTAMTTITIDKVSDKAEQARKYAEECFDWKVIADNALVRLKQS